MFTCTGSEANDLAMRVAKYVTGNQGIIVTSGAYHTSGTRYAQRSPTCTGTASDWRPSLPTAS
ncbi:hypothetical protein [Arthrobacter sp. B6]|uniref:hypothetical protein n=1 Tax=Arthrobacter sp. B6 TaxID=1570137 RepID=UPI001E4EDD4A|nr:hypothetical protein [Arthrobacter sp. B6]